PLPDHRPALRGRAGPRPAQGSRVMSFPIESCMTLLAKRRHDEIVVTSAGNSSEVWWETTRDLDATFYLEASMSLSTMFAAGLAMGYPEARLCAFFDDCAFVMNPRAPLV